MRPRRARRPAGARNGAISRSDLGSSAPSANGAGAACPPGRARRAPGPRRRPGRRELEVVVDPLLVSTGREEVVEVPVRCARRRAGRTGPIERFGRPGMTLTRWPGRGGGTVPGRPRRPRRTRRRRRSWRPVLAREGRVLLEQVRVGRDVDRPREARVGDRAVVALEVVLDARPSSSPSYPPSARTVERERVDVDAALRHESRDVAERAPRAGRRLGVGVDEDERPPRARAATGTRPRLPAVERRLRSDRGAPCAAIRRGRRSTRGRGTAASRVAPRPRRAGSPGAGRRSRTPRRAPVSAPHEHDRDVSRDRRRERAGRRAGRRRARRTASGARRPSRARAGARLDRGTSPTGSCG